ncbi:hypothetical protein NC653_003752 [Populus alba x Populus x berolinensis]|uniref:Uncharacterized protein n=1 Tax=Populus alba x Populus x berolinensis TaxID=444605 RepID=A0AAD6RSC2_9ROSI|nr:hypothetical protein NC653_003752 [Populus alba x Populus x berolinensis]
MFHNLRLSTQPPPPSSLNLSRPCFSTFISQDSPPPIFISQPFSHLSIVLTALHLHLSSLNFSHSLPSTFSSLISLNLSLRLLSTTSLLPQSRYGERTIIISHLSIFLSFSSSIVD